MAKCAEWRIGARQVAFLQASEWHEIHTESGPPAILIEGASLALSQFMEELT
jgi:hypothetical protein